MYKKEQSSLQCYKHLCFDESKDNPFTRITAGVQVNLMLTKFWTEPLKHTRNKMHGNPEPAAPSLPASSYFIITFGFSPPSSTPQVKRYPFIA